MTASAAPAAAYVDIDGRRWRASDPSIPEALRQELVDVLMAARRAVGAAMRAGDPEAEAAARRRVHRAKVALGERGAHWWEPGAEPDGERIVATIHALLDHRAGRTICPSDVARVVGGERWRTAMEPVRDAARRLAASGAVVVTQRGEPLDPAAPWRGPVRIGEPAT